MAGSDIYQTSAQKSVKFNIYFKILAIAGFQTRPLQKNQSRKDNRNQKNIITIFNQYTLNILMTKDFLFLSSSNPSMEDLT